MVEIEEVMDCDKTDVAGEELLLVVPAGELEMMGLGSTDSC